jgi:hypothetical protein
VIYAKAFFDLQLGFAQKVTALSGLPLAQSLLEYTNLYIRFGLGHGFDPAHPGWQEYLAGLQDTKDIREWTYAFYSRRPDAMAAPAVEATVGCFSYARLAGGRIRLHFDNAEPDGHSPLAKGRVGQRVAELAALSEHMKRTVGPSPQVVGASWLYNLEAYRRLFPPSYLATARVITGRFQHMPLWGQLLDRGGAVKADMARQLEARLERQASLDGLDRCFPFQVLSVNASVQDFHEFYGPDRRVADEASRQERLGLG